MNLTKFVIDNITAISGMITGVGVITVAAVKGKTKVDQLFKKMDSLLDLPERVQRIEESVAQVKKEVTPNGGTSFRDATLDRIAVVAAMGRITRENLRIAVYECDPDGRCTDVTESLSELFGISREDMLQNGWLYAIPTSEERDTVWKEWYFACKNKFPYRATYRIFNQQNRTMYKVTTNAQPVFNDNGERVIKYIGHITSFEALNDEHPAPSSN